MARAQSAGLWPSVLWVALGRKLMVAATGKTGGDTTIAWVRTHVDLLRILGVATAVLLLIAVSLSWVGFVVIAALLAAYELWLHRVGRTASAPESAASPLSTSDGPPGGHPVTATDTDQAPVL